MTAEAEIRRRISARGAITFAEFMEVALYHPDGGYYTSDERVGAAGDFYTSPAVHPAFGALLAVQLFQMWELLGQPAPFTVVEAGAGNGILCRDVATAAAGLPGEFGRSLRYICIDRRVSEGHERGLHCASRIASERIPIRGLVGCVLSNELLDAMPVHQVAVEEGRLREIHVAMDGGDLVTQTGEPSTPLLADRVGELETNLAEGQTAEINLALDGWIGEVSRTLERGFVLTVDYGRTAEELYSPSERFHGTLTTFHDHIQTDRPLERIGRQDISAQVDFTALARTGARVGLDLLGFVTQAEFLRNLGLNQLLQRTSNGSPRSVQSSRMGIRELAKPGGLGEFKVMALARNVGQPRMWGYHRSGEPEALADRLPTPMPTADHIDLLSGRYPPMGVEFEMAWDTLWADDLPPS